MFGSRAVTLRYPHRLCAPADKNGEGIIDPVQHLVGYETLRSPFAKQTDVTLANQFGSVTLDVTRRDVLLVPSAASQMGPPVPLVPPTTDHFQCYRTKRGRNQPHFAKIPVSVADEFESMSLTLVRPYRLCVPVDKNGEDPTAPGHPGLLLCYQTRGGTRFGTIDLQIANQFGPDQIRLIQRRELCVPSTKQ